MPKVPNTKAPNGGARAVDRTMPTTAVKVTSSTTLGLHSRQQARQGTATARAASRATEALHGRVARAGGSALDDGILCCFA